MEKVKFREVEQAAQQVLKIYIKLNFVTCVLKHSCCIDNRTISEYWKRKNCLKDALVLPKTKNNKIALKIKFIF